MADSVLCSTDERGVATLTLNRPDVHNAFDDATIARLTGMLLAAQRDPDTRLVVLGASGESFCSGADITWMRGMVRAGMEENYSDSLRLAELMSVLNGLGKPTIARVNGPVYGGGVGLVACCDIAVASTTARFALSEVRLGLVPAVISPYVTTAIGVRQARRYMLTGERFDAARARELELVHEICAPEALDETVAGLIQHVLLGGPEALRESKELIGLVSHTDRSSNQTISRRTAEIIAQIRVSPEGQEGLSAFLEKRRPNWQH